MNENQLLKRLASFENLEENWNSYGAKPITHEAIDATKDLITTIFIAPRTNGGIRIELGRCGDTIIDIEPNGDIKLNRS